MPRRLLHLDKAIVLWLDRRILHLASIKLGYPTSLGTGSTHVKAPSANTERCAMSACWPR